MIIPLLGMIGKIGSKLIVDKDKKIEFAFKTQEVALEYMKAMMNVKTYPWVDALVKLAYASEQIVKGLIRPIGSAILFAWGLYNPDMIKQLHELGPMGDLAITAIFGSLPAWGVDRGLSKRKKKKTNDDDWGD